MTQTRNTRDRSDSALAGVRVSIETPAYWCSIILPEVACHSALATVALVFLL